MPTYTVGYPIGASGIVTTGPNPPSIPDTGADTLIVNWGASTAADTIVVSTLENPGNIFGAGFLNGVQRLSFALIEFFNITTGASADNIRTGSRDDIVSSGAGNDIIDTREGAAQVNGGPGVDSWGALWGGLTANIVVNLQTSTVTGAGVSSVAGVEMLGTGVAYDRFQTGSGADTIVTLVGAGAIYDDRIETNAGNDTITVGGGKDTVDGGAGGDDLLIVDWSWTTQAVGSFHSGSSAPDWVGSFFVADNTTRVDYVNVARFDVRTGSGNDIILTRSGDDSISTGAGNDTLDSREGVAKVNGGSGVDAWSALWSGATTAIGVNLATNVVTGMGASTIAGIEALGQKNGALGALQTGSGADTVVTLVGSSAIYDDAVSTNGGDDSITVGGGKDTVDAGAGGNDLLIVDWSWTAQAVGSFHSGSSAPDWVGSFFVADNTTRVDYSNVARFDVRAGSGGDTILTLDGNDIINAGAGADTVRAGAGNDSILGGAGNDTLYGDDGVDTIYAGDGDDFIDGGAGASSILAGESGNDQIYGGAGNDYVVGGDGDDVMVGLGGQDSLYGGAGNDYIVAGNGPGSVVDGGAGANTLWGASGADYMIGGELADLLVGAAGSDYQFGNSGDDTHYGGQGTDFIYTNAGNDFVWTDDVGSPQSTDYIYVGGGTGTDTIADFGPGAGATHDVLVVSLGSGVTTFAQAQANMSQVGVYAVLALGADRVYLYNVQPFQLTAENFLFL